ncbi:hypothetical protein GCM10011492_42510 [Flexivirga endophytica]|uniref:DUF4307 domain-containing protein n=1 Tax=Flexivirga endophytica TaxID=1849103 RepID=A0A916TIM7_9MICO|nr:DUF4307 domain-containing protein [Flexivirga endophytica]GGB46878.1 hypothetical protein GCM10011492_42510 [Flexivirga endophytica]GHB67664.1 hypothetical protein GCM10008112_40660 [Flexivirga endophytica]
MAVPRIPPEQRAWWIIGTIGVLIMTAGAVWWGISATSGVSWDNGPFTVVNDRSVKVTFYVTNQDDKPVRCRLEAQDIKHDRVGVRTVDLPASHFRTTEYTRVIPTVDTAVTGFVDHCEYR